MWLCLCTCWVSSAEFLFLPVPVRDATSPQSTPGSPAWIMQKSKFALSACEAHTAFVWPFQFLSQHRVMKATRRVLWKLAFWYQHKDPLLVATSADPASPGHLRATVRCCTQNRPSINCPVMLLPRKQFPGSHDSSRFGSSSWCFWL